jgi:hypothetical protein
MTATVSRMRTRKVMRMLRACGQHAPELEVFLDRLVEKGRLIPAVDEGNPLRLCRSPRPSAKVH